jgi:hypothetical protein
MGKNFFKHWFPSNRRGFSLPIDGIIMKKKK